MALSHQLVEDWLDRLIASVKGKTDGDGSRFTVIVEKQADTATARLMATFCFCERSSHKKAITDEFRIRYHAFSNWSPNPKAALYEGRIPDDAGNILYATQHAIELSLPCNVIAALKLGFLADHYNAENIETNGAFVHNMLFS